VRKRYVADEEMNHILKLKQAGASWLRIQKETGIPRRTAKLAYEEWERTKSGEEIKRARTEVAAEEFRYHLEDLIALAQVFVRSLYIPMPMSKIDNADEILETLWKQDIRKEHRGSLGITEEGQIMRENKMLFRSLQDHTRGKVRWQAFEEWEEALARYISHCKSLRAEARQVLDNILNQHREFKSKLLAAGKGIKPAEDMARGVVEAVWRAFLAREVEEAAAFISTRSFGESIAEVSFGKGASSTSFRFADAKLAEEVADVCRQAARNVSVGKKSSLLGEIKGEMDTMDKRSKELEEMLNDLVLRPEILRTRCDLCPV
jgi:plasmid stability protein